MTIAVFGASGAIGKLLVKKALNDGYKVKAYVRNPKKIDFSHPNLTVVKGELSEYEKIEDIIKDTDAVISTLGPSMNRKAKGYPVRDGHVNIINAMEKQNISRFITLGTPSIKFEKDKKSAATVLTVILGRIFIPKRGIEEMILLGNTVKSSNLDWTIVRILSPVNDDTSSDVKVTFGDKKIKWKISRKNIASFMLDQVKNSQYIKSMPIIGS
ncbi:NAD(P)-binding oxidoreductase [Wukongibacter baidiensis]|uniref:NAD(P)-dependent oxidoreductase n=1 Tax=Wukongibacter baidiensis TaxID=1723361 RepID=UPI003D7FD27E